MKIWKCWATLVLTVLAGCGSDNSPAEVLRPMITLRVLSSPAEYVSGGTARIELKAPSAEQDKLTLWQNGTLLDPYVHVDGGRLERMISGLSEGKNILEVHHIDFGTVASLSLMNHPINGPMFSGPHQQPFVCTVTTEYGKQPAVESPEPPGFPVFDDAHNKIGYSRNCVIAPYVTYRYRTTSNTWKDLPSDGSRPMDLATLTLGDGRQVDFVVRQERGTINRFLYSYAMLAPLGEDPKNLDLGLWNRRAVYYFQGGVAIGHSQGRYHDRAMDPDLLSRGYAVIYSSGNNTGTHYNLQVAGETAMMTKEGFIKRYGAPEYTVGLGGSGGAIIQYILAQNHPGVIDAALPVQSYPDMVTQTIHVGDCELLERYMDDTDRNNPKWRTTKNRSLLVGLNAEEGFARVNDPLAALKTQLGYSTAPGSTECIPAWRGLTPLVMNPYYGQAANQALMEPPGIMNRVQWTHYDDLRNVYGVDEYGDPRTTWDNVGVQYGLASLKSGAITPEEFLDVNFKVGGWKQPREMIQEGFPFLGTLADVMADPLKFDPWSKRNMRVSKDPAAVPAPRTIADPVATRAAYTSGMVFSGQIPLPTIDHRQYMERELDMHNAHQSFAVRKRVIQKMGNSDHLVIWFTDTRPGVPKASQSLDALAVMAEWMANIKANPGRSVAENRPPRAVDSCFDVQGQLMFSGPTVWDGILNDHPKGACTLAFPIYATSRIVAGAPLEGGIYQCALKPVDTAVADGTYAPWVPSATAVSKLKQIFPSGVCDYSKPDRARPPGWKS